MTWKFIEEHILLFFSWLWDLSSNIEKSRVTVFVGETAQPVLSFFLYIWKVYFQTYQRIGRKVFFFTLLPPLPIFVNAILVFLFVRSSCFKGIQLQTPSVRRLYCEFVCRFVCKICALGFSIGLKGFQRSHPRKISRIWDMHPTPIFKKFTSLVVKNHTHYHRNTPQHSGAFYSGKFTIFGSAAKFRD